MKQAVFIFIIFVLFSGCEASIRPEPNRGSGHMPFIPYEPEDAGDNKVNKFLSNVDYNADRDNRSRSTEQRRSDDNRFVLITYDIAEKLDQLRSSVDNLDEMYRLKFSLSRRFNLILPLMNNGPKISDDDAFVDRSRNKKIVYFDTSDLGRLHIMSRIYSNGTFKIVFQKDSDVIIMGFDRSCNSNSYILSTVEYGTELYNIKYRKDLPHLCVFMNENILPVIKATPFSMLGGK